MECNPTLYCIALNFHILKLLWESWLYFWSKHLDFVTTETLKHEKSPFISFFLHSPRSLIFWTFSVLNHTMIWRTSISFRRSWKPIFTSFSRPSVSGTTTFDTLSIRFWEASSTSILQTFYIGISNRVTFYWIPHVTSRHVDMSCVCVCLCVRMICTSHFMWPLLLMCVYH